MRSDPPAYVTSARHSDLFSVLLFVLVQHLHVGLESVHTCKLTGDQNVQIPAEEQKWPEHHFLFFLGWRSGAERLLLLLLFCVGL